MKKLELKERLAELGEKYGLRYVEKDHRFIGLFRGIFVDAWTYQGSLCIYFYSPTVLLMDAVRENFKSFSNLAETAIPLSCLQRRMDGSGAGFQSCILELDGKQLDAISESELLAAPDAIAQDFHAHGASSEPPVCHLCGKAPASKLLYANYVYQAACEGCFEHLQDFVPGGVVKHDVQIQWQAAAKTLALWSAGFTLVWGFIQQLQEGVDGRLVLIAPFFGSVYYCRAVGRAAQGMNLELRVFTLICLMLCILTGNIWGLRTAMLRQGDISWLETIEVYFTWALTHQESNAWWYLVGGLAGSWVGLDLLKKQNVVTYR